MTKNTEPFEIIDLPICSDETGDLIPIEYKDIIPFEVKRSYFMKNVPFEAIRGGHAHQIEQEFFVCVQGSVVIKIDHNGEGQKKYFLNSAQRGMYVNTNVWHAFEKFSKNAVLLAFSSTNYMPGPDNYMNNYEEFCKQFNN